MEGSGRVSQKGKKLCVCVFENIQTMCLCLCGGGDCVFQKGNKLCVCVFQKGNKLYVCVCVDGAIVSFRKETNYVSMSLRRVNYVFMSVTVWMG